MVDILENLGYEKHELMNDYFVWHKKTYDGGWVTFRQKSQTIQYSAFMGISHDTTIGGVSVNVGSCDCTQLQVDFTMPCANEEDFKLFNEAVKKVEAEFTPQPQQEET